MRKSDLEIKLSKLKGMTEKNIKLEQYQSSPALVSEILWNAHLNGDITGKKILDAGCGNGIFGIGCLLLKAKKVYFLDIDPKMIALTKENTSKGEFLCCDINDFSFKVDVVFMNPPFGVHNPKIDKEFLLKAFSVAKVVYSIHFYKSVDFLKKISCENGFDFSFYERELILDKSYKFHTKDKKISKILICRFSKNI